MKFTRYILILGGFMTFACAALVAPMFGTASAYSLYAPYPFFDPVVEVSLQAAIATEEPNAIMTDERLKLLPGIEIRTALEDHQRLHYELG